MVAKNVRFLIRNALDDVTNEEVGYVNNLQCWNKIILSCTAEDL